MRIKYTGDFVCCDGYAFMPLFVIAGTLWARCGNTQAHLCGCGEPCHYDGVVSFDLSEVEIDTPVSMACMEAL